MRLVPTAIWVLGVALGCVDYPVVSPVFGCDGGARCGDRCVDLMSDLLHCGGCDIRCPGALVGEVVSCSGGSCVRVCEANRGDCDGDPGNGCETDVSGSVGNCGSCGVACPGGGDATCAQGRCGIRCVGGGRGDCDGTMSNGCEIDLTSDARHCGTCHSACPLRDNATIHCEAGSCGFSCVRGHGDCDRNEGNGCEVDLGRDPARCGDCATQCPVRPNASAVCRDGTCGIQCVAGFGDCDGDASNGCEINLRSNVSNCGECGRACPPRDGVAVACQDGACAGACVGGRADCDRDGNNGCEADLLTDRLHCGACGTPCIPQANVAETACRGGACVVDRCRFPYGDCDYDAGNGCELMLGGDDNCNACGNNCRSGGQRCVAGDGGLSCQGVRDGG